MLASKMPRVHTVSFEDITDEVHTMSLAAGKNESYENKMLKVELGIDGTLAFVVLDNGNVEGYFADLRAAIEAYNKL